jgi:hypothetical protein
VQFVEAVDPARVARERRRGLVPQAARPPEGVADPAARVICAFDDPTVCPDEAIDELPCGLGLDRKDVPFDVVEPIAQLCREVGAVGVGDERSPGTESLQALLERGHEGRRLELGTDLPDHPDALALETDAGCHGMGFWRGFARPRRTRFARLCHVR